LTAAAVTTSQRDPFEWLGVMADVRFARLAIDRLRSAAPELVLDDKSYRERQRTSITTDRGVDHAPTTAVIVTTPK
jgi:hypothetical protein